MYSNFISVFSLFIFTIGLFGCQQKGENEKKDHQNRNQVIIAGEIKNPKSKEVTYKASPSRKRNTLKLNKNNEFQAAHPIEEPVYLDIKHDESEVKCFAKPGDSLYLSADYQKFDETVKFSGTREKVNNYLAGKTLLEDSLGLAEQKRVKHLYSREPSSFLKTVDSIHNIYKDHFQSFVQNNEPSAIFKDYEEANIGAKFHRMKINYPNYYQHFNDTNAVNLPEGYYSFRENLTLDNPKLFNVRNYRNNIEAYLDNKMESFKKENKKFKDTSESVVYKKVIKEETANEEVRAQLMGQFIKSKLMFQGLEGLKPAMAYYKTLPYDSGTKARIDTLRNGWQSIQAGKKAPGFAYPDTAGDTVRLKDLRGNYVYIDAWATWCGPCLKELPHLKKLHDKFKDQNVKFVSISLDKPKRKQKWRKMVQSKNLKGYQLIADSEGFKSDLAQEYLIYSIPRFILINPEGKIIDSDAEKPSEGIEKRLKALLEKSKPQTS